MPKTLAQKLLTIQENLPDVRKNAKNPHFKNTYVTLDALRDAIRPLLNEHKLVLHQYPSAIGDTPALTSRLENTENGEVMESTTPLILQKEDPQGVGSAITYMCRYHIAAFFGLDADEDDDGEAARSTTSSKPTTSGESEAGSGSWGKTSGSF